MKNLKLKEKRVVKGYKIQDSRYKKAMKRAKKEGGTLSNLIESFVIAYSEGSSISIEPSQKQLMKVYGAFPVQQ